MVDGGIDIVLLVFEVWIVFLCWFVILVLVCVFVLDNFVVSRFLSSVG